MIAITERQKEILDSVIEEYIKSAQPVSSRLIEEKYDFEICPATIRNEMQALAEKGYLDQPHTSAGRVPTDKGYRFFVNEILDKGFQGENFEFGSENWFKKEIEDTVRFVHLLTKNLAAFSSNFVLSYMFDEKILWKEGWEEILQKPEFKETKLISNFAELIKNFEKEIEELPVASGIQVYIGRENPFPKVRDFTTIISRCHFPNKEEGVLAILGPKRMSYQKNIGSIHYLTNLLEEF